MKKIYLIATIVAIITGFAIYNFASSIQNKSYMDKGEVVNIVVASAEIKENTELKPEMLTIKQMPKNVAPQQAAKTVEQVVGKVTKYPISIGEMVITSKLFTTGDNKENQLSYNLENGKRAVSINVDAVTGVAGYIKKGDRVDIIINFENNGVVTTRTMFENILVIRVGANVADAKTDGTGSYSNVTLSLTPDEAMKLHYASAHGPMRLTLRPALDKTIVQPKDITGY